MTNVRSFLAFLKPVVNLSLDLIIQLPRKRRVLLAMKKHSSGDWEGEDKLDD